MAAKTSAESLAEWLNKNWIGDKRCPICTNNQWSISEKPLELREYHGGGLIVGGPVYPLMSITCNTCGNTQFFNAVVAGLLPGGDQATRDSGEVTP